MYVSQPDENVLASSTGNIGYRRGSVAASEASFTVDRVTVKSSVTVTQASFFIVDPYTQQNVDTTL